MILVNLHHRRDESFTHRRATLAEAQDLEPSVRRMAHGIPGLLDDRLDRVRSLGNSVVPETGWLAFVTLWRRLFS